MRPTRILLLVALASLLLPAASAQRPSPDPLSDEEREHLNARPPIRIQMGPVGPPMGFPGPDGRPRGIQMDFFRLMSVRAGFDFNATVAPSFGPWYAALEEGRADILGPMSYTADRAKNWTFIGPFAYGRVGFWISDRDPQIHDATQLAGRRVGIGSTAFVDYLQRTYPGLTLVMLPDPMQALDALSNGTVDALYAGYANMLYYIRERSITGLRTLGEADQIVETYWVVRKNDTLLASALAKALATVSSEEREGIYLKWVGADMGPPDAKPASVEFFDSGPFRTTAGIGLAAVGFLTAWGVVLRRQVRRHTRQLHRRETELRAVLDSSPVGIARLGEDGRITGANRALQALLHADEAMLKALRLRDLLEPAEDLPASLKEWGAAPREVRLRRPDGGVFPGRVQVAPLAATPGATTLFVATVEDVTAQKEAERSRWTTLEKELENRRLRQLDRYRRDLIKSTAHELNSPLTPLKLQLQLLRSADTEPKDVQRAIGVLDRNIGRLELLVRDMMDAAQVEEGGLVLRPARTDLCQIIRESAETFAETARRRGVTIVTEAPPTLEVDCDPARVTQVVHNLISNAIKFSREGGRVTVRIKPGPPVEVSVEDQGVGLSMDQIRRLFQPFGQVHEVQPPGTGLGLYISKGIVEMHGGGIEATSDGPGQGATFRFWLPPQPVIKNGSTFSRPTHSS